MAFSIELNHAENVTMTRVTAEKLLQSRDGNAALLYLFLLQRGCSVSEESILRTFQWSTDVLAEAERTLERLQLISGKEEGNQPLEQAEETPEYSREDIAQALEGDRTFSLLTREIENRLGKKLNTKDLQQLLGLYSQQGLPAEVILLLTVHCIERAERHYGIGRRPTMRQIEKEGFFWSRIGVDSIDAAEQYLKKYAKTQGKVPELMRVLQLGDRNPVAAEEKYLLTWLEWGFAPDMVEKAYEKTVMKCNKFQWNYCNAILSRWKEQNIFKLSDLEKDKKRSVPAKTVSAPNGQNELAQLQKYVKQLRKDKQGD